MKSPNSFISTESYGNTRRKKAHVGLVVLHGSTGGQLFKENPGLLRLAPDEGEFQKYLAIESDFGTLELAREVARAIDKLTSALRIDITHVDLPLGIIDVNALDIEAAVRNVLDPEYCGSVESLLGKVHQAALGALDKQLGKIHKDGILVSLHSCSPGERIAAPDESYDRLGVYNRSFTMPENQDAAVPRLIDIVTALPNGRVVADEGLVHNMERCLEAEGFPVALNSPFSIQPGTWQLQASRGPRFAALDVPKHHIAEGSAESVISNLAALKIDKEKVEKLAGQIAMAIVTTASTSRASAE